MIKELENLISAARIETRWCNVGQDEGTYCACSLCVALRKYDTVKNAGENWEQFRQMCTCHPEDIELYIEPIDLCVHDCCKIVVNKPYYDGMGHCIHEVCPRSTKPDIK